jgi:hypothetical protein
MPLNKIFKYLLVIIPCLYFILLIPEADPVIPEYPKKQPFVWDLDSLWYSLESQFLLIKNSETIPRTDKSLYFLDSLINDINLFRVYPGSPKYSHLEKAFFHTAPQIGAFPEYRNTFFNQYAKIRFILKDNSLKWDMNDTETRRMIYRLLYGGRAAVEEIMLQNGNEVYRAELMGYPEPSVTPKADILGVTVHSGDILVSRGGAPTSALIARGNDYPGNFSHIALVYVDEKTHIISIIESHIERGVTVSSLEEYLGDKKLRVMILRLRSDLPPITADPMLPHKAASYALTDAKRRHIPYDFEMDYKDPQKQFCSEVAFYPYSIWGIHFWKGISNISSHGIVSWLAAFGVKYFETHQPSDLEYDPQLRVVAEWRDPETLYKDHIDNAVIEAMLERANEGKELNYSLYLLPVARILKVYSIVLNQFGLEGTIPEGMSPAAALRNEQLSSDHEKIKLLVLQKASDFRIENNYTPPYWQLVRFATEAVKELKY